jgi:hypothetical protein
MNVGAQHAAPPRRIYDLLPTDDCRHRSGIGGGARVERAWTDAAHHLEVARRMGEPPPRDELLIDPGTWRSALSQLSRLALAEGGTGSASAPPEHGS